ncbi:MAG: type II toxin-antitoxin system RatA family toxin [Gammaproteobacteria bacterium]|nr:MAG: type II toxin-antitoxin system RatA family toxin [Gammaproteobacteria bacterium]
MPEVNRSALVMYSADQMFSLVNGVEQYPEFLPWCGGTHIVSSDEREMVASIEVAKSGLRHRFTTRNTLMRPERIDMHLVDGPFRFLHGSWHFKALDEQACKVELTLKFELNMALGGVTLGPVFSQAVSTMVDAFVKRAKVVYG